MGVKFFLKRAIRYICSGAISSEEYIDYLKSLGVKVGKGCKVFDVNSVVIDTTRPFMLEIGEYVKITRVTVILCHDYSRSVLRRSHNQILAEGENTIIGNNVFLGINSIVLAGSKIGNNVIVGAGSVISGVIPDNVVVAGNPAKVIRTLDEHFEKRKSKTVNEAINYVRCFKGHYGRLPTEKEMGHFFPLFLHTEGELKKYGINLQWSGDEETEILASFLSQDHPYESLEEFFIKEGLK